MPYDLTKTHYSLSLQKDVASGQTVDREGVVLRSVLEAGVEKVQKADDSAATHIIAGFAVSDNETIGVMPAVLDAVIPAAPGPYTVQLKTNIVGTPPNSSIRVAEVGGSDFTEVTTAPNAGEFQPNVSTGVLTFNSGDAGKSITVWYRHNLTVAESRQRFFQRNVNNEAGALFNTVVVGGGSGEVWTFEYDTNVDWTTAKPGGTADITTGPDGILTIGGTGTPIPGGKVVHVPDSDDAALGLAFNLPG